ncbi:MAG: putative PEP-binding protein [Rickettsiales bacterium]
MTRTLKILAIDDDHESIDRAVYAPLKRELSRKDIDLEYKIVENYDAAIGELRAGFRPDAITNDYMMREYKGIGTGPNGFKHLEKILLHIDGNIPNFTPKPFMMTASTNEAKVQINRSSILRAHNTEIADKSDIDRTIISHLESPDIFPITEDTPFSIFLREKLGEDIIAPLHRYSDYKDEEPQAKTNSDNSILQKYDLSDNGKMIKSLSPDIDDEIEGKTHRVDCLKSNDMPINGYVAFNEDDVNKLLREDKEPVLFMDDYDVKKHSMLLPKLSGIVCLGTGGSHLLDKGIPTISKSDREVWNSDTGEAINYYRIEQIDGKSALVNNSHAVKRAVFNWQQEGENVNNPPQPEYDNPQKNKIILFKAGDKVTLARNAAYQGHLKIEYPDVTPIVKEVEKIASSLPFKSPHFLATLNSASDMNQGYDEITKIMKSGAEGIGLIRTENMYNNEALENIKEGILSNDSHGFVHLGPIGNFRDNGLSGAIHNTIENLSDREPLRIRLFDFPPDEFFSKNELKKLKERVGDDVQGTPLALKTKGLYENQLNSIFNSTKSKNLEREQPINLQIMAPHINNADEMEQFIEMVEKEAKRKDFPRVNYKIGAMIETKSITDHKELAKLAKMVDFVSFGTNDLTQEITEVKRPFEGGGINPYEKLDDRVKDVMRESIKILRENNPNIIIGCCGSQMKDLDSLTFAAKDLELDDVSMPSDAKHLVGRRLQLYQRLEQEHNATKMVGSNIDKVNSVTATPKQRG